VGGGGGGVVGGGCTVTGAAHPQDAARQLYEEVDAAVAST
jgi:hypothetical protein